MASGQHLVIADAAPEDAAALAAVHAEGFDEAWTAEAIARLVRADASLTLKVSAADGTIVGFVMGFLAADESEVLTIAVAQRARRQGVGLLLMSAFADAAQLAGASSVYLDVAQSNLAARRLYERLGYVETGRRRGYYKRAGGGEDAIVLTKTLAGNAPDAGD